MPSRAILTLRSQLHVVRDGYLYTIQAESPKDIQAGVRFSQKYDLRVAIQNTGNFLGRSLAPESLQINTHLMTDKRVHKEFNPAGCSGTSEGLAVTVGAGGSHWLGKILTIRATIRGNGCACICICIDIHIIPPTRPDPGTNSLLSRSCLINHVSRIKSVG